MVAVMRARYSCYLMQALLARRAETLLLQLPCRYASNHGSQQLQLPKHPVSANRRSLPIARMHMLYTMTLLILP